MRHCQILLVDSQPTMARHIGLILTGAGYEVLATADGDEALRLAASQAPDLVVMELLLPGLDGLQVCSRLRAFSDVPLMILSVKEAEDDKIVALDAGADDYMTKPFSRGEFLARVRALLRRPRREGQGTGARRLVKGPFVLDPEARHLAVAGRKISLTPTEFDVLHYLIRHAGRVVPHNMLLGEVWGADCRHQTEYLRVYVGRLRQKIEDDPARPCHIRTAPGLGYVFEVGPSAN